MSPASRGSLAAGVCIALVVAAVVWFLRTDDPRAVAGLDAERVESSRAADRPSPTDGASLAADERAAQAPARVESKVAESRSTSAAGPTLVLARVTAVETGGPVEHVHVTAWSREGTVLATPQAIETDEEGEAEIEVEPGVALVISAQGDRRTTGSADVSIEALAPGERRSVAIEIVTREDLVVHGLVLRRDTREPVAGVAVEAVSSLPSGPGATVTTGNDGRFRIAVRSFATAALRYEHQDFGTALSAARAGHEDPARALEVLLERAASIRAVASSAGGEQPGGWIAVATALPDSPGMPTGWSIQRPEERSWMADVGADGVAELARVPARTQLAFEIRRGSVTVWQSREPLVLEPGEAREIACRVGGTSIQGFVREADGAPASRVLLGATATGESAASARAFATSEGDGAYRFEGLAPGAWLVGPEALVSPDPRDVPAPIAQRVVVEPDGPGVRHDIVLVRGLVVAGRVERADGKPAPHALVLGRDEALDLDARAVAGADGAFVLGPLSPGVWTVHATKFASAPSPRTRIAAGTEDVVLRLGAASRLEVVVRDADGQSLPYAPVTVVVSDGRGESSSREASIGGEVWFDELAPGTYDVVVATRDGRYAARRAIALADDAPARVTLVAEPAGRARVRFDGPDERALLLVTDRGALVSMQSVARGATVEVAGPPGRVTAQMHAGGRRSDREIELRREPGPDHVYDGGWR